MTDNCRQIIFSKLQLIFIFIHALDFSFCPYNKKKKKKIWYRFLYTKKKIGLDLDSGIKFVPVVKKLLDNVSLC